MSSRTLVMASNTEVSNLATMVLGRTNPERTTRIFNARLTVSDSQGMVHPYLAEALPQLHTESWRVSPDGRMETVWKLRPNLTWHDGTPLTASDFVFAHEVYTTPELPMFEPKPLDQIETVIAPDDRSVVVRWRAPYLDNGAGLDPLPRHIFGASFEALQADVAGHRDAFLGHRAWSMDYVGAGPYRLVAWEPGSHLEGTAFAGHALGRPRIERVMVRVITDENTALTNVLAESVSLTMTQALTFEHGMVLRREWGLDARGRSAKGVLLYQATATTSGAIQFRPEYQTAPALLDLRVRKALIHAIDREALNDALFDGQNPPAHTFLHPTRPYYGELERAITRYGYDPRLSEQLMAEAGFRRAGGGMFAREGGEPLQVPFWNSAPREQMAVIVSNAWQQAGFDVQPTVLSRVAERDLELRATFPALLSFAISLSEQGAGQNTTAGQIPTASTRWSGANYAGWSSPEYERLWEAYNRTLDRSDQVRQLIQMMKLRSEQLPVFPFHYNLNVMSHVATLVGPEVGVSETTQHWNIHTWEFR
jgi:peptide/nickel transport system substrate-binding protein